MPPKGRKRKPLLSSTRPSSTKKPTSLSSRATRSLIRTHHVLQKQLTTALASNDTATATSLQSQLSASGGLPRYQEASIQGQSSDRGGDSSRFLMQWLSDTAPHIKAGAVSGKEERLRMLEVGALRVDNACSRSGVFDVTRIDLHSQELGIEAQDFMERPVLNPIELEKEGFDIVSLSLVVNYVGDAFGRGEMLRRVGRFLRRRKPENLPVDGIEEIFPGLFLVLPAPCVTNSRYLDEDRLIDIMRTLGFEKVRRKMSAKLVYYLWRYDGQVKQERKIFKKEEIRLGKSRNNFAIVLL